MTKATLLKDGINWGIVYNLIHFHVREHGTIKATTGALVKSATFGSTGGGGDGGGGGGSGQTDKQMGR